MDSKYGRLFTEEEVRLLLADAYDEGRSDERIEELPPAVVATGLGAHLLARSARAPTFPADEPLFLLRGQDTASAATIGFYTEECERVAAGAEHVRAAQHAGGKLLAWQAGHLDRVKAPD